MKRTLALAMALCVAACDADGGHHRMLGAGSVSLEAGVGTLDAGADVGVEASASPNALYYVYASADAAAVASSAVDRALGYPSRGVDVGDGIHVGPDAGWTTTYAAVVPSADGGGYAYLSDLVTSAILADSGAPEARAITLNEAGTFAAVAVP